MNVLRIILLFLVSLLILFPLVFFPPELSSELLLSPQWTAQEDEAGSGQPPLSPEWVSLLLNDEVLFAHTDGYIAHRESKDFYMSYDSSSIINTSQYHDTLVQKNAMGDVEYVLSSSGFPYILGDNLAIITPDGLGLTLISGNGVELFNFKTASIISDVSLVKLDSGMIVLAVGFIDGRYRLYSGEGLLLDARLSPIGSRFPIVYNLELFHIEPDSEGREQFILASLNGFDPLYLVLHTYSVGEDFGIAETQRVVENMDFSIYSQTPILYRPNVKNERIFSVAHSKGYAEYKYSADMSVLIDETHPSDGLGLKSIQEFPWKNFLYITGDIGKTRFSLVDEKGEEILSRELPFISDMEQRGTTLLLRGAGFVSSYILELM